VADPPREVMHCEGWDRWCLIRCMNVWRMCSKGRVFVVHSM
jgi:hypothetical protein